MKDEQTAKKCYPLLEAFEAGAFSFWVTGSEIHVATIPSIMKCDGQNRLHCEDGPAFKWMEGIEDYYWHGVHVPREWITDRKSLTPQAAITWKNIEQRRAAIDIVGGWPAILRVKELNAKVIDEDPDQHIGTLLEVNLPNLKDPQQFLWVQCGTGREFALCVPKKCKTAREAQAWLRPGMTATRAKTFTLPEVRT